MRAMLRAAVLLILLCGALHVSVAAEPSLTVSLRAKTQTYKLSELLAHPARTDVVTDNSDEAYKRPMRYVAIPIETLLTGLSGEDDVQFVALDGYAPVLAANRLKGVGGARAFLAIEPGSAPWPALGPGKLSPGPFYLIWSNASGAGVSPSEWPWQIATIRVQDSLAQRFPLMVPDRDAPQPVRAGFDAYGKQCLSCHTINGQGEASMGPDLNVPMNPTEYFNEAALKQLVRDPKSVRSWSAGVMPGFDVARLSQTDLDNIVAYLKHMVGKKKVR